MKHLFSCVAILTVLFGSMVRAQDTVVRSSTVQVGIGASVNASSIISIRAGSASIFYPVGFMNVLIPISFAKFRIEPEFGLYSIINEVKSSSITATDRQGIIRLGLAAHYMHNFGDRSQFYVGPRFALFMNNSSTDVTDSPTQETNWTDVLLGASLGGEYLFSKHFSLGAEVQLNYIMHGNPEEKPEPSVNTEESGSILTNNAALIVRWYFN